MLLWKFIFDAAIGLQVDGIGEGHTGEAGAEATRIDTENEGARLLVVIVLLIEPLAEVSRDGIFEWVQYRNSLGKARGDREILVKGIDMICIFFCHHTKRFAEAISYCSSLEASALAFLIAFSCSSSLVSRMRAIHARISAEIMNTM